MSRQIRVVIVSAALVAALSGIAQAATAHHRGSPAANATRPSIEAILHRLPDQNIYGMAIANPPNPQPTPSCNDMTCPGFSLIGIGF